MKKEFPNYGEINFINSYAWLQADWAICGMEVIADAIRHKMKIRDQNKIMDFECKDFEIHPYWDKGCTCGYIKKIDEWEEHNPHEDDCMIAVFDKEYLDAAKKHGPKNVFISEKFEKIKCTCGADERFKQWAIKNNVLKHSSKCCLCRPNFIHNKTGISIKWIHSIGNFMTSNVERPQEWQKIIAECVSKIKERK